MKKGLILPIVLGSLLVVSIGLFFLTQSDKEKAVAAQNEAVKNSQKSDSIASLWKKVANTNKGDAETANGEKKDLQAALDTIEPKALISDSLQTLVNDLQKQLLTARVSSKKGNKAEKVAVKTQVKKLKKGSPVTDDNAKTFTYCKSDSLLAKAAPSGYKLVQKPR